MQPALLQVWNVVGIVRIVLPSVVMVGTALCWALYFSVVCSFLAPMSTSASSSWSLFFFGCLMDFFFFFLRFPTAPSRLHIQHGTQCGLDFMTLSWSQDLSWDQSRMLNRLSYPGTPFFLSFFTLVSFYYFTCLKKCVFLHIGELLLSYCCT